LAVWAAGGAIRPTVVVHSARGDFSGRKTTEASDTMASVERILSSDLELSMFFAVLIFASVIVGFLGLIFAGMTSVGVQGIPRGTRTP
jgi:hypothetical protein